MTKMYAFSKITATTRASKRFALVEGGQLVSSPGIPIYRGIIETLESKDAADFADVLASLWPTEVLLYGLSDYQYARITTKKLFSSHVQAEIPTVPRSKSHITYRPRPGILCLDYDPQDGKEPLTHSKLLKALGLYGAPMVLAHSASTYVYMGDEVRIGHKGKRVYVLIQDATDIPRAGMALFQRLVVAGYGWTITTASDAILMRTLIDRAMFSPVQIDYAAGAVCAAPLCQRRPEPLVINNDSPPLDTRAAILDLTEAERQAYALAAGHKPRARSRTATDSTITACTSPSIYAKGQGLRGETMIEVKGYGTFSWWHIMHNRSKFDQRACVDPFHNSDSGELKDAQIHTDEHAGIASFSHGGTYYHSPKVLTPPANERRTGQGKPGMPKLPRLPKVVQR